MTNNYEENILKGVRDLQLFFGKFHRAFTERCGAAHAPRYQLKEKGELCFQVLIG